jgi:hypothetical protein
MSTLVLRLGSLNGSFPAVNDCRPYAPPGTGVVPMADATAVTHASSETGLQIATPCKVLVLCLAAR